MGIASHISKLPGALLAYQSESEADLRIVDNEEDIRELEREGEIEEEEAERLIHLLENPVDINKMDVNACYELPRATYEACIKLIRIRELKRSEGKGDLLISDLRTTFGADFPYLKPFLKMPRAELISGLEGTLKLKAIDRFSDPDYPAGYLRVQGQYDREVTGFDLPLQFGLLTLVGERYQPVRYDPAERMTVTSGKELSPQLAKGYLAVDKTGWSVIAGSYTIGFGQRLTFDTTNLINPYGWKPGNLIYERSDNADYEPYKDLFGVAAGLKHLTLGDEHSLDATAFFSHADYDLYQYDLAAHEIWDEEMEEPAEHITMPDAYREQIVGGHLRFNWDKDTSIGTTLYRGDVAWLLPGAEEQFASSSRYPSRDSFSAVGADFAIGLMDYLKIFGEYTRMDTGAQAGLVRGALEYKNKFFVDLLLREYGTDFDNPHARATASPDEKEGNRARDERGAKLKLTYYPPFLKRYLRLQGYIDRWMHPSTNIVDEELYGRLDFYLKDPEEVSEAAAEEMHDEGVEAEIDDRYERLAKKENWFELSTWLRWHDNNLARGGREEDYEENGEKYLFAVKLATAKIPRTHLAIQYNHYWEDEGRYKDRFEQSAGFYLRGFCDLSHGFRLSGRVKLFDEDWHWLDRGERYWWGYGQIGWSGERLRLSARYDYLKYTDTRESTEEKERLNPQHTVRAMMGFAF